MVKYSLPPPPKKSETTEVQDPIGIATHHLFDEEQDPVHQRCAELGLGNATGARVKVIQVPIYLRPDDGLFEREYEAVLSAMDLGIFPSFYEPWGYTPQESVAVGVPTITTLSRVFPNPFNPSTTIKYTMPKTGHLSLNVYNVRGQLVKSLIDGVRAAGDGEIVWDGTDNRGARVASGAYYYRLTANDRVFTKKMMLVK